MAHTTRQSILLGLISNDERAWMEFQEFYTPLIIICGQDYRLTPEEINDLRQEVMEEVFEKKIASKFNPARGRFRSLLRTIIHRKASAIFKRRVPSASPINEETEDSSMTENPLEARWDEEWREFIKNAALKILREESNERQYMAFDLYVLQGMEAESVASIMNMTTNQVYIAKNRLGGRLREIVASLEEDIDE